MPHVLAALFLLELCEVVRRENCEIRKRENRKVSMLTWPTLSRPFKGIYRKRWWNLLVIIGFPDVSRPSQDEIKGLSRQLRRLRQHISCDNFLTFNSFLAFAIIIVARELLVDGTSPQKLVDWVVRCLFVHRQTHSKFLFLALSNLLVFLFSRILYDSCSLSESNWTSVARLTRYLKKLKIFFSFLLLLRPVCPPPVRSLCCLGLCVSFQTLFANSRGWSRVCRTRRCEYLHYEVRWVTTTYLVTWIMLHLGLAIVFFGARFNVRDDKEIALINYLDWLTGEVPSSEDQIYDDSYCYRWDNLSFTLETPRLRDSAIRKDEEESR